MTCCYRQTTSVAVFLAHLSFSVLAQFTICLLSVPVSLFVCLLSSFRARGAIPKRMSPLSQCYIGEIDSLALVLSAAICWCFHIAEKWGKGVVKTSKVRITTLATTAEERLLLSHRERHYFPNPSVPESGTSFWSTTLIPAFTWSQT